MVEKLGRFSTLSKTPNDLDRFFVPRDNTSKSVNSLPRTVHRLAITTTMIATGQISFDLPGFEVWLLPASGNNTLSDHDSHIALNFINPNESSQNTSSSENHILFLGEGIRVDRGFERFTVDFSTLESNNNFFVLCVVLDPFVKLHPQAILSPMMPIKLDPNLIMATEDNGPFILQTWYGNAVAPVANTVLCDTGAIVLGVSSYEGFQIVVSLDTPQNGQRFAIQHRNAANIATLDQWVFDGQGSHTLEIRKLLINNNERIRVLNLAAGAVGVNFDVTIARLGWVR